MPRILFLFLVAAQACGAAVSREYRSAYFLDRLHHSQEILFSEIVRHYDSLLSARRDPGVHIEKCKFLAEAMYNEESEENPMEEQWDSCYQDALRRYPDDARVMAYRLKHSYGDSAMLWGLIALDRIASHRLANVDDHIQASIHLALARAYAGKDSARRALAEFEAALRFEDTLNVNLSMARQLAALGQKEPARAVLLRGESRLEGWEASQAGELLLQLGYPRDAARFYGMHRQDTAQYTDYAGLAKALEQSGEIDSARIYHAKALGREYNKERSTRRQFEFDLRHSPGPAAIASYRALRAQGIKADPLGFDRMKLFALHPWQPVNWQDLGGLALFLLALAGLGLSPYLWVLPFHYFVSRWIAPRRVPQATRFNLSHFWICSAAFLIAGFLAAGFFRTQVLTGHFGGRGPEANPTDWENTLFLCSFSAMLLVFAVGFLRVTKSQWVFRFGIPPWRALRYLAGCLLFIYAVRRIQLVLLPEDVHDLTQQLLEGSVLAMLRSCLATLGLGPTLLMAAVMVPIYEEVLFRGVFQESAGKYLPFWIVNPLQAAVFAGLHDNVRQFPTLFAMGLSLGWLARKTGSLALPMLAHGVNNLIAVTALWAVVGKMIRFH